MEPPLISPRAELQRECPLAQSLYQGWGVADSVVDAYDAYPKRQSVCVVGVEDLDAGGKLAQFQKGHCYELVPNDDPLAPVRLPMQQIWQVTRRKNPWGRPFHVTGLPSMKANLRIRRHVCSSDQDGADPVRTGEQYSDPGAGGTSEIMTGWCYSQKHLDRRCCQYCMVH